MPVFNRKLTWVCGALALAFGAASTQATLVIKPTYEFKKPRMITIDGDLSYDTFGSSAPVLNSGVYQGIAFEGISQYDGASFGRNFIPPDTMGAVGMTQYMETTNGAYAIFDKSTGARLSLTSDVAFWQAVGLGGTNGDSRVMYNAASQRWIAIAFGTNVANINIAISDTDNALGSWKGTSFTGFAGGTADYPTLALDTNAVYIGTNDFKVGCSPANPAANAFCGVTLNVIPLNSLFNATSPTTANMKQIVTSYRPALTDAGFALQGVNSSTPGSSGMVVANSAFFNDNLFYSVDNINPNSAAGATTGAAQYLNMAALQDAGPGRQPATIAANRRVIDTLDQRISSSVYEADGRVYTVQTVDTPGDGLDEARVRFTVFDKATGAILDEGDIGAAGYDYYQGSIAVNKFGDVVIGYNRSGLDATTGKISFLAQGFRTGADGKLVAVTGELFLKESLTNDYHNGSLFGQAAAGRQRWGDYSQVSVDPANVRHFWLIGQFAREYNLAQFGHPGGTGGSRWGTWISMVSLAVPEPQTWVMMILGFGLIGGSLRKQRKLGRGLLAA